RPAAERAHQGLLDRKVEARQVELRLAPLRKERLLGVRQQERAPRRLDLDCLRLRHRLDHTRAMCDASRVDADLQRTVRRNTILLASTTAVNSVVLQLAAAVSSLTFVLVTGHHGLLGLGPAIFLTSSGLTAVVAGRSMDRFGRRPVLAGGFVAL